MKRIFFRICVLLVWLGVMVWHVLPPLSRNAVASYADILGDDVIIRDSWHKIYFAGEPAGISNTRIDFDENSDDARFVMTTTMEMTLSIMGTRQKAFVDSTVQVDARHRLSSFEFELDSNVYKMTITGKRLSGNTYTITTGNKRNSSTSEVTLPEDAVISNPMQGMMLSRLPVGKETSITVFDPIAMVSRTCRVQALRKESLTLGDKVYETTVLESEMADIRMMTWVDSEGNTVRQETPFGHYELCDFRDAMKFSRLEGNATDLLARMAVKASRPIESPRKVRYAVYRLEGATLDLNALSSDRQSVVAIDSTTTQLEVQALEFNSLAYDQEDPDLRPWLAPTRFIQSDSERLKNKALEITEGQSGHRAAIAIGRWVHENVQKVPAVSIPSSLDVLDSLEGDCNEHTYLFAGLARSIGIPTRIMVGIVYMEGAFYYHAWPSVYAGNGVWTAMDPTFGQDRADATHIAITEGEIDKQMEIMRLPGKLSVHIVSTSTELSHDSNP